MAYASLAILEQSFGTSEITQLLSRYADNNAVLLRVQQQADSEINARLAGRYAVPLSPVPAQIVGIACDIIRYKLYDDAAPEQVINRYRDALTFLDRVQSSKAMLIADDGAVIPQQSTENQALIGSVGVVAPVMQFGAGFEDQYQPKQQTYNGRWV